MTPPPGLRALQHVVALREREERRLAAELATQQRERERYLNNLARLQALTEATGPSGALPPLLAVNCSAYKQAVLGLAQRHREALQHHDSDMGKTRAALGEAVRRHQALERLRHQQHQAWQAELNGAARKQLEEAALNVWRRGMKRGNGDEKKPRRLFRKAAIRSLYTPRAGTAPARQHLECAARRQRDV